MALELEYDLLHYCYLDVKSSYYDAKSDLTEVKGDEVGLCRYFQKVDEIMGLVINLQRRLKERGVNVIKQQLIFVSKNINCIDSSMKIRTQSIFFGMKTVFKLREDFDEFIDNTVAI